MLLKNKAYCWHGRMKSGALALMQVATAVGVI
jgi:hypothetical protein